MKYNKLRTYFFFIFILILSLFIVYLYQQKKDTNAGFTPETKYVNNKIVETSNDMDDVGFFITRHVNNKDSNQYWNHNVKLIRKYYQTNKIIIIDDNSNYDFIEILYPEIMQNVQVINSEYQKRGELLPYYYFYHLKPFKRMIFLHDSAFLNTRLKYDNTKQIQFLHNFQDIPHNIEDETNLLSKLDHANSLIELHKSKKWVGCWGGMTTITHDYLKHIVNKYNLLILIHYIQTRSDRMALERVLGVVFCHDDHNVINTSIFGDFINHENLRNGSVDFNTLKNADDYAFKKIFPGR